MPKFQTENQYKTQISYGIHVGYAVEGSIGTDMKVDPLYLSSDVQLALRIEELNEQYNTSILMTGELYDLLSEKGQERVRKIDQILVKQSLQGMKELYSFDMKPIEALHFDDDDEDDQLGLMDEKAPRLIGEFIKHEDFGEEALEEEDEQTKAMYRDMPLIEKMYSIDHDFLCIFKQKDSEMEHLFNTGLRGYLDGDWQYAAQSFAECKEKLPQGTTDGPLEHLIKVIEKAKGNAPDEWQNAYDWDKKPTPPPLDDIFCKNEDEFDDDDD